MSRYSAERFAQEACGYIDDMDADYARNRDAQLREDAEKARRELAAWRGEQ